MSDGRKVIWDAITPVARRYGFHLAWQKDAVLESVETTRIFNLQKSQWGEQFYLNCSVGLKRLDPTKNLKAHQCHIQWRVESLMDTASVSDLRAALDLEKPMDPVFRATSIANAADRFGLSLLARCETEADIIAFLESHEGKGIGVLRTFKERDVP